MRRTDWWRKALPLVAVVGVAAFVAGGRLGLRAQDNTPIAPAPQPACELVTEAEAEAALGAPVVQTDAATSCAYTATDPQVMASLSVTIGPDDVTQETFSQAVAGYADAAGAEMREVLGVGEEAYTTLTEPTSQLLARSGERYVTVILINVQTPDEVRIQTMSDLARTALSRLEGGS